MLMIGTTGLQFWDVGNGRGDVLAFLNRIWDDTCDDDEYESTVHVASGYSGEEDSVEGA